MSSVDISGNNWFKIDDKWDWHEGSTWSDSEGKEYSSNYTVLLRIEKTGRWAKDGAGIEKMTLLGEGEKDILASGTRYTGKLGTYITTPNGDYEINLKNRGRLKSQYIMNMNGQPVLGPHFGIQQVGHFLQGRRSYDAIGDWGTLRASLIGPKRGAAFYLHGKRDFFDFGRTYTHGCSTEPHQKVLETIFKRDPSGVGEGDKNGRILVNVSGR